MKEAAGKTTVEIVDRIPDIPGKPAVKKRDGSKKTGGAGAGKEEKAQAAMARTVFGLDEWAEGPKKTKAAAKKAPKKTGRAKARSGSEKITPAALYRKMITFGKAYQVEKEQDFIEAARIYAEEAGLIDQMRDRIAEDGLTVEKTYKTGSVEVAHPLLSELPRHVESANKCLATIGNMIGERGARVEKAARDLDAFRLH